MRDASLLVDLVASEAWSCRGVTLVETGADDVSLDTRLERANLVPPESLCLGPVAPSEAPEQ